MSRVAIVGGGLAGMACAAALAGRGLTVELFEARKKLGGRAGSYIDRATGDAIDHCQHVAMGCCTNYRDFCRRTGISELFHWQQTLHFFDANGRRSDFSPTRWLPAPLHMIRPFLKLRFLSLRDKISIARCLLTLIRSPRTDSATSPTILAWLKSQGQSDAVIERFWKVILVSALAESLDRASLAAARKIFVDGFLAHPVAASVLVPTVSLDELYQDRVKAWLTQHGVRIHLETPIAEIVGDEQGIHGLHLANGSGSDFDHVVVAVPWTRIDKLLSPSLRKKIDPDDHISRISGSPISSVHLWFDRPIMNLPNAIMVERLAQWVFARSLSNSGTEFYYQVVISASHNLAGRDRESVIGEVCADIVTVFPRAAEAKLLRCKLINEDQAVFSQRPGLDAIRLSQQTTIPNLVLAGDWTRTGWPATMEGAVRSGYLAAETVLKQAGKPEQILAPDLPRNWLAQWL